MPWLEVQTAYEHVQAAEAAATDQVPSELLLGIAYVESRYDPTALSRVENGTRRTGRYPSTVAPATLTPRSSLYCGPLQTYATSWSSCMAMRDLKTAYRAAANELQNWLSDRRVRGNVGRALAGHGCGNYGVTTGNCNGYPTRVRAAEQQIRLGGAQHSTPPRNALASS